MKYRYFYQTSGNENREGEISAKNRAEAYAKLRKSGIRPYRVVGDDPAAWRRWMADGVIAALLVASGMAAFRFVVRGDDPFAPMCRRQIYGDPALVEAGAISGWEGVFESPLDRYLAAYAIPGREAEPPLLSPDEIGSFADELSRKDVRDGDERSEHRQLRNIVAWMKDEMRAYLAAGGTVGDYLALLDERQQIEMELREKAAESVERAPRGYGLAAWLGVNAKLRDMGIAPIEAPADREDD